MPVFELPGGSEAVSSVTVTPGKIDHVAAAIKRLPQQFKGKPNIEALLRILVEPAQDLEDVFWILAYERTLTRAVELGLDSIIDLIGKLVGEEREGRSNADYAKIINARIAANRSHGLPEELITIARLVLAPSDPRVILDLRGGGAVSMRIEDLRLDWSTATILAGLLRQAVSAGVRSLLEFSSYADFSKTFRFGDVTGSALSTGLDCAHSKMPLTATAMNLAVAYGVWDHGWLFDILSGNDPGVFGGVAMTAAGGPAYNTDGPRGVLDRAVSMDSVTKGFTASAGDVSATADIAMIGLIRTAAVSTNSYIFSKQNYGTGDPGYYLTINTSMQPVLTVRDGVDVAQAIGNGAPIPPSTWIAIAALVERGAVQARIGYTPLSEVSPVVSPTASIAAIDSLSNAQTFNVAARGTLGGTLDVGALYLAYGTAAAQNMSANLAAVLTNFANTVNRAFGDRLASVKE